MPITETSTAIHDYPMSRLGINLHRNIVTLDPEECLLAQNCIWDNGMVKRGGQSLVTSTEVVASNKILGLHRFYKSDATKQLLAASGTTVKYLDGTNWSNAVTGLTTSLKTYMTTWGALNKAYICNGTDAMRSWTGSAAATITIADGVPKMALPYQDRLLTIIGGNLTWSASFDDTGANWITASSIGVKPDTILFGMCYHSVSNESAGFNTKILLAGANGMYLFWGTDLRAPYTTGDYQIYPLAIPVGCNAPRTMCWTPRGTMWLGIDRQVYLLPFDSVMPVPIGSKIRSNISGTEGIESIPAANIENAAAVYHDGYYKLSVTKSGGSYNTNQWWLDVGRMYQGEDGLWGPWYGPMAGQSISCYAVQNGAGDIGQLVAGEDQAKGYVYYCGDKTTYGDIDISTAASKAISVYWTTFYNPLGNVSLKKEVHKLEAEIRDVLGTVTLNFSDIAGSVSAGENFTLSGSAQYWDDNYWNDEDWSSSMPTYQAVDISPAIKVRKLSISVSQSIATDAFALHALRVAAVEQAQIFE